MKGKIYCFFFVFIVIVSCSPAQKEIFGPPSQSWALGTICRISLPPFKSSNGAFSGNRDYHQEASLLLNNIENIMSAHREGAELYRLSTRAGGLPITLSTELFALIEEAFEIAEKTGFYFNPAVGPLVSLWGIGEENPRIPTSDEIKTARALTSLGDINLNPEESSLHFAKSGMSIDLGAIAKGYAADTLAELFKSLDIPYALIDLGGNIFCHGRRPDGRNWRIGIQDPDSSRGDYLGVLELEEGSVVTSGDYERYFEEDGKRYHHILDPETGWPAENDLRSVTVVSHSSARADAYATAAFVAGSQKGLELITREDDLEAIFIVKDGDILLTAGLKEAFSINSSRYRVSAENP